MICEFYEAIFMDYTSYCKVNNRKPQVFVCSRELRAELKDTVMGLPIEVDNELIGYTSTSGWYWM